MVVIDEGKSRFPSSGLLKDKMERVVVQESLGTGLSLE